MVGDHDTLRPPTEAHDVPFHDVGDLRRTPDEDRLLARLTAYDIDLIVLARGLWISRPSPEAVFGIKPG